MCVGPLKLLSSRHLQRSGTSEPVGRGAESRLGSVTGCMGNLAAFDKVEKRTRHLRRANRSGRPRGLPHVANVDNWAPLTCPSLSWFPASRRTARSSSARKGRSIGSSDHRVSRRSLLVRTRFASWPARCLYAARSVFPCRVRSSLS